MTSTKQDVQTSNATVTGPQSLVLVKNMLRLSVSPCNKLYDIFLDVVIYRCHQSAISDPCSQKAAFPQKIMQVLKFINWNAQRNQRMERY